MSRYRISVIMGIYNCAKTLVEALDSLYAQTYQDFQIIMCDDGSIDNTYTIAQEYAKNHSNIILLKNDCNRGLNYTLNYCLEYVDTEYVARMDGDDISLPTRFEKEIAFLDSHPEYAIVSCPMIYFDENGDYRKGTAVEHPTISNFIKGSPFCHAPMLIKTDAIKAVNGYTDDKRFLRIEDYNLFMKLYKAKYIGANIQEHLYKMRDDRNAFSRRTMQARFNSTRARLIAYKTLGIRWYKYHYAFRPIVIGIIPYPIYQYLRNLKHKKEFTKPM